MNHNLDKLRPILQQLPHEAVVYLFPYLFPKDSNWSTGLQATEPLLFRQIPSESTEAKSPSSHSSKNRTIPEIEGADLCVEIPFDENDYLSTRDAFVEQEIQEEEERGQRIRAAVERFLEENHTTREELRRVLGFPVVFSHLRITRAGNILLTDYDNREVKMDTLSKVIFILFLNHSEGIAFMDLWDYKAEMMKIYGQLTHRYDMAGIEDSIDRLCNTVESNSINEKVSRIKRAFLNAVDEDIAEMYYIKGPAGGIRKIELRRDFVSIHLLL